MCSYYRTGLLEDALRTLSRCEEEVARFRHDPHALKWLLISLHCTVQSFMASVLEQGNGLQIMKPKVAKAWLKAHYGDEDYPTKTDMDYFLNLYEKIKDADSMRGYASLLPFKQSGHDDSIATLNEWRNQYIHFNISSWSIEVSGLHELIKKVMDVVQYCSESTSFPWHRFGDSKPHRDKVLEAISKIRAECESPFSVKRSNTK
jgi:hypothetical protein